MKRTAIVLVAMLCAWFTAAGSGNLAAQGVTTSSLTGTVTDPNRAPIAGAQVVAVHQPSGTRYGGVTRADGRYSILGMRVGGPYIVSVSFPGRQSQSRDNVTLNLGVATDLDFVLSTSDVVLEGLTITAERGGVISSDRTGAATTATREAIAAVPNISGRLDAVARLSPQSGGGLSFAGQDNRLNNITIDGSSFNNSFGLGGAPGERTGVAPVSLQAIEQVQINVAPFDVRQGNFVGANVNTVTRSGTNDFRGSVYYQMRDQGLVGKNASGTDVTVGTFSFDNVGGWISGPIVKNKLFFFANYENESMLQPGTTFRANRGGEPVKGNVTRVTASSLDSLRTFLGSKFNYETGPYQGYDSETPATRFLAKVDYNVNDRNKLSLRYNHLDSNTDVLLSNSSSLGFGNRRTSLQALNFQNSNYQILENIRSLVGEWNASIGTNMANNLIVGYTYQDESRASRGSFFPFVDILEGGSTYTSFGFEPFTPNNELRYKTFQIQNNFTRFGDRHTLTFGASAERYLSENTFFSGAQSVYTYNSLADFYTDANDYLANPNRTTSPVTLRRFQVRWANIPGMEKPLQELKVWFPGIYAQDEWQAHDRLKLTLGLRVDVPFFDETGFANADADKLTFRDENGKAVQYSTAKLPDANLLFSPRFGFNWDVRGDRSTQLRGGTGIFTGRPAYVWISNQIGNTGVLTGFEELNNTTARPFNPNPDRYKPTNVTGAPASSYELALTNPDFKFPQLWRTNFAVDQKLPFGLIGTGEFLYNRDVNGVYYINANLTPANTNFTGPDNRPRWTTSNRINANVANAVVMKNQHEGYSWNASASLERPFRKGVFLKAAYSYGEAKNTVDPGSVAFGSWNNNQHVGDPNNPGLGYSSNTPGHRFFMTGSYRKQYFGFGATTVSLFWERRTIGNASYVYSGDLNGDGGTSNDLLYIPKDVSEMNFQTYTDKGRTYTALEQAQAWEAFIQGSKYLSSHRGQYAERGAVFLPMVTRADLSIAQELFSNIRGKNNGVELRADITNVGNLLNKNWGTSQAMVTTSPLVVPSGAPADALGRAQYRLRTINGEFITNEFQKTAGLGDLYQVRLQLRYTFN